MNFQEFVDQRKLKTIVITCRDEENILEDLLNFIKTNGNTGHSFPIYVDPKENGGKKFYWDGDGTDHIENIQVK